LCGFMSVRLLLLHASAGHANADADCADIGAVSNYDADAFTSPNTIADTDATDILIYDRSDSLGPVATAEPDASPDRSSPDEHLPAGRADHIRWRGARRCPFIAFPDDPDYANPDADNSNHASYDASSADTAKLPARSDPVAVLRHSRARPTANAADTPAGCGAVGQVAVFCGGSR